MRGHYEMSGRERVRREVTHSRQKIKENHKQFAGKNHQEIDGGVLNNISEERLYTSSMYMTPLSSRKYDNEESRAVFDEGGLADGA